MNISKQNAMQIVAEISNIINQRVNMMDENGIIIASTDPKRIGTFHAAALRIINEKLDVLIIHDDSEYEGARKGINLPVLRNDDIVGVIGVTGEYEDVSKYGQIIKKMTEILLLETYSQEQKKIDDRIKIRFLDEWLFEERTVYGRDFIERGNRLGIDIELPRRVLIAEIIDLAQHAYSSEGQRLIDNINKTVRHYTERDNRSVFAKTPSQMICLLTDRGNENMRSAALDIQSLIKKHFDVDVRIGIDGRAPRTWQAHLQAKKALRVSNYSKDMVCLYDDITLEIFMDEISQASKKEFLTRIFRGSGEEEISSWVRLLQIYYDCDGSISKAAERMFIHKNTLQYKLNRLFEQTGYDPRKLQSAALFILAIQFHNDGL